MVGSFVGSAGGVVVESGLDVEATVAEPNYPPDKINPIKPEGESNIKLEPKPKQIEPNQNQTQSYQKLFETQKQNPNPQPEINPQHSKTQNEAHLRA